MSIPVSWLVTALMVIAAVALAQSPRVPVTARVCLCGFLVALAISGVLLGMRLSLGIDGVAHFQPLVAVVIPVFAYLGFFSLTRENAALPTAMIIRTVFLVVIAHLAILIWWPISVDLIVVSVTIFYVSRMALLLRLQDDDFVHVPPHALKLLRTALIITLTLLSLMIMTDGLVMVVGMVADNGLVLRLLSGISGLSVAFVFVTMLIGLPMALRGAVGRHSEAVTGSPETVTAADHELLTRLDALMLGQQLYRDNNLTVARLGRRLGVPAREVTHATNRVAGSNFSRFVNGYRIRHAQQLLRETDLPVTEIMLESGFSSKSSFNTEFRRLTGQTPSQYRKT
ncbi:helix-turn-helix domain-containing protein [Gynuella sp.]|uniref:helix-turn-helix domain-containing protein n=1 Tax=Gynuella sp. TaxID=2969146 RepID=UPI003D14D8B5